MKITGINLTLPDHWKWSKCNDVIDVRDGTHDTPKYVSSGYPLITSKNLKSDGIDFSTVSYISEKDHFDISKRSKVDRGDILLAMIGTIGNPVIVDNDIEFSIKNMALFKFSNSVIDPKYFKYLLETPIIKRQLDLEQRGGTQKFVSLKVLREMLIPYPPIAEQKRIVAILDKADAIRRKRQEAIKLTEEFARSLFLDMFGDPVTNPKGWDIVSLKQIAEFENGDRSNNYPSGKDLIEKGILFLSTKNIAFNKLDLQYKQYISQEKFNSLNRGKLKQGDLIITLRGTLGNCCIFESDYQTGFINAQMMIIRVKKNIKNHFLHTLLTSQAINKFFQEIGNGAAVPQLTGKQIQEMRIYLPPIQLQEKFSEYLGKNKHLHQYQLSATLESENLFNSLLQRAFKGEL